MAVAVLHDEFTPHIARGGVCASGEIIVGPAVSVYSYVNNRVVVFDPVSKTADTYEVAMSGTVTSVGRGCAWNGGVAMVAGSGSAVFGVLTFYPDGTYDVLSAPLSGGGVGWMLVGDGTTLVAVKTSSAVPQVFTPGVGWSTGSSSFVAYTQPLMSGGGAIGINGSGDMYTLNMSTGNATTLHSGVGTPPSGESQAVELGGRLWYSTSSINLRGVRISDGNIVNIIVPTHSAGTIATDGTHLFVVSTSAAVYQVHPITLNIVAHTLSTSLGTVGSMHFSAGKVWVPGGDPTS